MPEPTQTPPTLTILPSGHEQGTPSQSAVEKATEAARARVAEGKPAAPAEPARHPGTGQFVEPGRVDTARELGTPRAGQAPPAADQPPVEGQEPPATPAATEGQPAPDAATAPAAPPADETEEQRVAREAAEAAAATGDETREDGHVITFTGRNDQAFELVLPIDTPKETIEAVKSLRNSVMRSEEIRAAREEVTTARQEFERERFEFDVDPVGSLLRRAADEPIIELADGSQVDMVEHTVLHLLTQPKVFERLRDRIEQIITDERELRTVRAETQAQRGAIREELRTAAEERAVVSRNLQDVQATVGAILPTDWSEGRQRVLYADCMRDLKDYADRHNLLTIQPKDIPAILSHRLTAYGINPAEAATRAAESAVRRGAGAPSRPAKSPAQRGAPPAPARSAPPNGQRFMASAKKKETAGSIPPGGAGSPAGAPLTPPRNADGSKMTIEQTVAWHRQQLAKGARR